jgi:regulator of RNase E activity RraA
MDSAELRLQLQQSGVVVNGGERIAPDEEIDFPVFSLVFFPNSPTRRTMLVQAHSS